MKIGLRATSILLVLVSLLIFDPVQVSAASSLYFIHTDHLGSTAAVTDEKGEVVFQNRYYPYGSDRLSADDYQLPVTERKYTSQIKDSETNLYYYNARYYDPALGTFISADSTNDQINRYAYVRNNPIMAVDPSGNAIRPPLLYKWAQEVEKIYLTSEYRAQYEEFVRSKVPGDIPWLENFVMGASESFPSSHIILGLYWPEHREMAFNKAAAWFIPSNPTELALSITGLTANINTPPQFTLNRAAAPRISPSEFLDEITKENRRLPFPRGTMEKILEEAKEGAKVAKKTSNNRGPTSTFCA